MAEDRLTSSDKRALLLWVALGIVGALFAYKYFFRAFPEASVNFQVSREEAVGRAQKFLSSLGQNVSGYQSVIVFNVDDNAKVYLERQLGLQQANQLMSSELNIWFWDVRFFKPQQEEEFKVRVNPGGQIVGYTHKIEESRAGASLDRAAAQTSAQNYLQAKLGIDLSRWEFLPEEANSNKRPNRLDWSFTWEKRGFRAKEAPYRLQAIAQGDRIGGSEEFLKVPEAWERSYQQLRSENNFYNTVAIIPYIVLFGGALWVGITLTRRGQTSWGGAIKLGIIAAVLLFFMQINQWPLERAGYDTNTSYEGFVLEQIAKAIVFGLVSALTVSLILPGAEPLYRASQPNHLRLGKAFTLRGLRSKEFFVSAVVGLSLAAAHIGFVVAFYIVAGHYGAWSPQELNYEDSVNTAIPWIAGVAIGLLASTSEEFLFRLFAIPFLERLTRSRLLAVVLPAFCWSFLHSAYPNEPPYIRGIEVGLIGIVAGFVMLRWGILATLIWHYTVDASLVGLLLIRSNSLYFKVSGLIVAALALAPLLFSCASYIKRGRFEPDQDLLNGAVPAPEIRLSAAPASSDRAALSQRYDALTAGIIGFLAMCFLVGGALLWRVKPQSIGDYLRLSVNARTATAHANEMLRKRGLDPNSFHHATLFADRTDPVTNEYLSERIGIPALNQVYARQVPGALWVTRYFRDAHAEEYSVVLKPDGSLHSVHHTLAEAAPGASLDKNEALERAEKFLREEKQIDLRQWSLVEAKSQKLPHRIDHTFTWQQNTPLDPAPGPSKATGQAFARMELNILGDEVANYRTYIKIPDEVRRKREERTLLRLLVSFGIPYLLPIGLGVAAIIIFLMNLRTPVARAVPWRKLVFLGGWGLLAYLAVIATGNRIPFFLNLYPTQIPFKIFLGSIGIGILLGAVFYWGCLVLLFGLAWYYAARAFGEERLPGWTGMPAVYYRDALWIGLGGSTGLLALGRLLTTVSMHWPTIHRALPASFGDDFDAILPIGSISGGTLLHSLLLTGIVVGVASFIASQVHQRGLRILLFLVGAFALVGGGWGSPADLAKVFLSKLILLGVLVLGVGRIMRFNILGCFLIVAGTSLLEGAVELLSQPDSFYRANGYAVLLALVLLFAWPFAGWRMRRATAAT